MRRLLLTAVFAVLLPVGWQDGSPTVSHPQSYLCRLFSPENLPSIGLLIAGIAGIIVAIGTLRHMRESSERQLQAYVLPEQVGVFDGTTVNPPQPARANVPGVFMLIKNFGQTPAYRVVSWAQIAVIVVANENAMLGVPPMAEHFATTLGPGGTFNKALWFDRPLSPNEIADIAAGVRSIYVYGKIEYQDTFKKSRFTNFRLHYSGAYPAPPNSILGFSERGNDAN
jgi:hypothetical protein